MLKAGAALQKRESDEERNVKREQWKRDLSGRANGTIDPWYGCFLFYEVVDYAINFTFPWSKPLLTFHYPHANIRLSALGSTEAYAGFDVYDVPDALYPEAPQDASIFLNGTARISR